MKLPVYTLSDEEFAFLVNRASEVLKQKEIDYALVGGVGVQAHILHRHCKISGKNITDLVLDPNFRSQDYLRSTDSIDIALRFTEYDGVRNLTTDQIKSSTIEAHIKTGAKIRGVCDAIVEGGDNGEYTTQNHFISYEFERDGIQRPAFHVIVDGEKRNSASLVFHRRPEDLDCIQTCFYGAIIQRAVPLVIPFSDAFDLRLNVARPEYLLAVKIASDRPKDKMDVENLVYALRLAGEFDLAQDYPRFAYQLKKCLLPQYEDQLRRFCDDVRIPDLTQKRELALSTGYD